MIHRISGTVIHWEKLWRQLWFPTANVQISEGIISEWTYKINIIFQWKVYSWAWSYLQKKWVFEAHIFDFSWNLYDETLEIILLSKIRDNIKFTTLENLKKQIQADIDNCKNNIHYWITFWTFDHVHKWHEYYLQEARKYCDTLVTIIARDSNVKKIKGDFPLYWEDKRLEDIKNLQISDKVFLWHETNPMIWFEKYNISSVLIWYDQISYIEKLKEYNTSEKKSLEIIKIWSFQPEIFKSSKLKKSQA